MTAPDAPERACDRCRNFEASDDGHFHVPKWAVTALVSVVTTVLLAAGGWVWFLSGEHADAHSMERRVSEIEQRDDRRDDAISDIRDRLARMETALKLLVDRAVPPASR